MANEVHHKPSRLLDKQAELIGTRVRDLRQGRRWSQAELGAELAVSQARLSQIERGQGSFTAEQFLRILGLFNVGVEHFVEPFRRGASPTQNALARHGAAHLVESEVLVPTALDEPTALICEVLRAPESPRHISALAPVLVVNVDRIAIPELAARLGALGRTARLGWLLESLRDALAEDAPPVASVHRRNARRAALALDLFLSSDHLRPPLPTAPLDVLDSEIRSAKTAERTFEEASPLARRWRLATRLRTTDFLEALRDAREAG